MIVVPTYLNKSEIHGFGVFAKEFIPRGKKVWEFNPTFDIRFTEEEFESLPSATREEIEIHLYQPEPGGATRDIQPGEELTCDYRHFMADVSHITYL